MPRPAPSKRRDRGSIEERGGSFRVKVFAGLDPLTGKRLYLTGSSTNRRDAEKIRTKLLVDVDAKRNATNRARSARRSTSGCPSTRPRTQRWRATGAISTA